MATILVASAVRLGDVFAVARVVALVVTGTLMATGCGTGEDAINLDSVPPSTTTTQAPPPTVTVATETTTLPPTTAAPTTTFPTMPEFASQIEPATEALLGSSWRPGCPVGVDDLRILTVSHWNDIGDVADGQIVVHIDHADDIVSVFERLFEAAFPIHSMLPITEFDSDDDASMAANNSSGFNCREVAGAPGVWSQHSYGGAVDINPLVNPWVRGRLVDPPEGERYVDRTLGVAGMIVAGDVVTQAFAEIGWGWGGDWSSTLDYQHFSHNGQ